MFQALIVIAIVILAAFYVLKNIYTKLNPASGSHCDCGCSGCNPSVQNKKGCDDKK